MSAVVLRLADLSIRLPRRLVGVNLVLGASLIALFVIRLHGGTFPTSPGDVIAAISGEADQVTSMIVLEYRLPRLLVAIGAGLAFGLAGELVQTFLRNPLASPDIIGFTSGAACAAVLTVVLTGSTALVLPGAITGGLAAAALVLGLSWRGGLSTGSIVLIGIGIGLTLSVLTDLLLSRLDLLAAETIAKWLVGSLQTRSVEEARLAWLGLTLLAPIAFWHQFALGRSSMGRDTATALGLNFDQSQVFTIGLVVALVALAVATAGPLPFVAFVAGPIAHGLNGQSRPTLLSAALVGALVVLIADAAAQSLPGGLSLPTGIFTARTGAPVLIAVLILQARKPTS